MEQIFTLLMLMNFRDYFKVTAHPPIFFYSILGHELELHNNVGQFLKSALYDERPFMNIRDGRLLMIINDIKAVNDSDRKTGRKGGKKKKGRGRCVQVVD